MVAYVDKKSIWLCHVVELVKKIKSLAAANKNQTTQDVCESTLSFLGKARSDETMGKKEACTRIIDSYDKLQTKQEFSTQLATKNDNYFYSFAQSSIVQELGCATTISTLSTAATTKSHVFKVERTKIRSCGRSEVDPNDLQCFLEDRADCQMTTMNRACELIQPKAEGVPANISLVHEHLGTAEWGNCSDHIYYYAQAKFNPCDWTAYDNAALERSNADFKVNKIKSFKLENVTAGEIKLDSWGKKTCSGTTPLAITTEKECKELAAAKGLQWAGAKNWGSCKPKGCFATKANYRVSKLSFNKEKHSAGSCNDDQAAVVCKQQHIIAEDTTLMCVPKKSFAGQGSDKWYTVPTAKLEGSNIMDYGYKTNTNLRRRSTWSDYKTTDRRRRGFVPKENPSACHGNQGKKLCVMVGVKQTRYHRFDTGGKSSSKACSTSSSSSENPCTQQTCVPSVAYEESRQNDGSSSGEGLNGPRIGPCRDRDPWFTVITDSSTSSSPTPTPSSIAWSETNCDGFGVCKDDDSEDINMATIFPQAIHEVREQVYDVTYLNSSEVYYLHEMTSGSSSSSSYHGQKYNVTAKRKEAYERLAKFVNQAEKKSALESLSVVMGDLEPLPYFWNGSIATPAPPPDARRRRRDVEISFDEDYAKLNRCEPRIKGDPASNTVTFVIPCSSIGKCGKDFVPTYYMKNWDCGSCPANSSTVTSQQECQQLAEKNGYEWDPSIRNWSNKPKGCYAEKQNDNDENPTRLGFNSYTGDSQAQGDRRKSPVCKSFPVCPTAKSPECNQEKAKRLQQYQSCQAESDDSSGSTDERRRRSLYSATATGARRRRTTCFPSVVEDPYPYKADVRIGQPIWVSMDEISRSDNRRFMWKPKAEDCTGALCTPACSVFDYPCQQGASAKTAIARAKECANEKRQKVTARL
jgi:hypothetical protein